MRILFLFSGLTRTLDTNIQNIHKILKNDIDYDIYIHNTLNDTEDKYNNIIIPSNITENNYVTKILSENINISFDINNKYNISHTKIKNTIKQLYKIYQLFKLVPENYYDYIIRIRSDLFIFENINYFNELFQKINKNILYIPINNDIYDKKIFDDIGIFSSINDQFCICSYNIMKIYSELYLNIKKYDYLPFISEIILYQYLKDNNIQIERIYLNYKLLLSTCNILAISGDSGSGKSTLLKAIEPIFCFDNCLKFETDRYHKWERGNINWNNYTHLNPEANYLEKLCDDTYNFKIGNDIITVDYDHKTGKFTEKYKQEVKDNIILCGLHTLYPEHIRNIIDIKIYIDTEPDLKKYWKIQRDVKERGYELNKVLNVIEKRQNDFINFIDIQKQYADIIVHYYIENNNYNEVKFEILLKNEYYLKNMMKLFIFKIKDKYNYKQLYINDTNIYDSYNVKEKIIEYICNKKLEFIDTNKIYENGIGLLQYLLINLIYN
jgi:uridine kinase